MDSATEYAIIYQKHTGKNPYYKGYYTAEFVNAICKQHKEMKDLKRPKETTTADIVDVATLEANFAAMLLDIKKTVTGQKKAYVDLSKVDNKA